ncbi:MAG TPA: hypothetical protein VMT87_04510 [Vicinamibacteria bacterium]|nr:hypothetical protein [Vicinamibacteria bacterium]
MTPARARAGFLVLCAVTFAIFRLSPVRTVTDSRYSLLLGENLLRHRELALDRYFAKEVAVTRRPVVRVVPVESLSSGPPRRLPLPQYTVERVNGRLHYYFPHAGSVLALPYLAASNALGLSVLDGQGRYVARNEERLQAGLAALLMGLATGVFFRTALELVPVGASVILALVAALGTPVWSTASRVLWSDTWGVTLLAAVIWMLVASRARGRPIRPVVLGSLLAWAYFVRPTNCVHAALVLAYLAFAHRAVLARVVAAGALWGVAFASYSYTTFGTLLPPYFQGGRLGRGYALEALLANLVSPSRGILFFVPVVPLAVVLLWRHWRYVRERSLARLGVAGLAAQFVPLLFFDHWWGGFSYGPRLLTGLVPWAVLVGVLVTRARLDAAAETGTRRPRRLERLAVAVVCAWSVLVNGRGALSADTERWNVDPVDVDAYPSRVWDWRDPQFLTGLRRKPAPLLHAGVPMAFGQLAADGLFGEGWSAPEGSMRWSVAPRAALLVRWPRAGPLLLRLRVRPAPAWAAAGGQPLALWLDGRELARWHLSETGPVVVAAPLEADGPAQEHRLELRVPDIPAGAGGAGDARPLRTGVYSLRLDRFPVLRRVERVPFGDEAASAFTGNGWGDPEGPYRWTVAPRADLYFASEDPEPAVLRFRLHPFLAEGGPGGQRVVVDLNGTIVGTLALRSEDAAEHAIPLLDVGRANTLGLELPDAVSRFGPRLDPRRLGVALHWLGLDPFPPLRPGRPVALAGKDAAAYLGDGWAEPEGTTRWSVGVRSEIVFKVDRPGPARLLLTMEPFSARARRAQRVRVELNDRRLGELRLDRPGRVPHAIVVPDGVLRTHNVLRLILPDARSPASLGLSRDHRVLGVRVGALEWRPE